MKEYIDGGLIGYGTEEGGPMVLRLGDSGSQSGGGQAYIRDSRSPVTRSPFRRSTRPPSRNVASRVHRLRALADKSAIRSHARSMFATRRRRCDRRPEDTYRYIIWPFALLLGGLLAWEGATGAAPNS